MYSDRTALSSIRMSPQDMASNLSAMIIKIKQAPAIIVKPKS